MAPERTPPPEDRSQGRALLTLRALRSRYLLALGLIAALTISSQAIIQHLIESQEADARVLNLAGRQRMLATSISRSVLALASDIHPEHRGSAGPLLAGALDEWESMHASLAQGNPALGLPAQASPPERDILARLEPSRRAIAENARRALELAPSGASEAELDLLADRIFNLTQSYLPLMDSLVSLRETQSRERVQWLGTLELILAGSLLAVLALVALFIFRPVSLRIRSDMFQLTALAEEMRALSLKDGLTGIFNRRHFDEQFSVEWRRAAREDHPLSLLLMDIDHFKLFNDRYGHQAGDQALKRVAWATAGELGRPGDFLARYGGEEFAIVLANTGLEGALLLAENIRRAVEALSIPHGAAPAGPLLTVSLGVASGRPARHEDPGSLLEAADQALYRAKQAGRNRVAGPPGEAPGEWS